LGVSAGAASGLNQRGVSESLTASEKGIFKGETFAAGSCEFGTEKATGRNFPTDLNQRPNR